MRGRGQEEQTAKYSATTCKGREEQKKRKRIHPTHNNLHQTTLETTIVSIKTIKTIVVSIRRLLFLCLPLRTPVLDQLEASVSGVVSRLEVRRLDARGLAEFRRGLLEELARGEREREGERGEGETGRGRERRERLRESLHLLTSTCLNFSLPLLLCALQFCSGSLQTSPPPFSARTNCSQCPLCRVPAP